MNLGEKLFKLRKNMKMSQEEVAEHLQVSRQTISNWELNQTTPDINQSKALSNLYKVSLDELVSNDTTHLLTERVSNVENLAGIIIKILKVLGILFVIYILICIIGVILFSVNRTEKVERVSETVSISCSGNNKDYLISIGNDGYFNCSNCSIKTQNSLAEKIDYSDLETSIKTVKEYFMKENVACE